MAAGQTAEEFYAKNNRLTLLIGFGAGTGYDVWGRIVTQHMAKHMPGKATFIMQHMPGAGSLAMANYLYNVAPKDGTVMGSFSRNLPSQVMIGLPNANLDPRNSVMSEALSFRCGSASRWRARASTASRIYGRKKS